MPETPDSKRLAELLEEVPLIDRLRAATAGVPAYLVGGAVRDLLLGQGAGTDLDIVVEGASEPIARSLGEPVRAHPRFMTAAVSAGELAIDVATARRETYDFPGALPRVEPASIEEDLGRRDFTVNAMAVPLHGTPELLDPHGGLADLKTGTLRLLHGDSVRDDPTRALRAARYAARLGFALDPVSEEQVRGARLETVAVERVEAELRLIAVEERVVQALLLLAEWGLAGMTAAGADRTRLALAALAGEGWEGFAHRADVVLAAAREELPAAVKELAALRPERPSEAVRAARGRSPVELVLARAAGARWLDDYVREWRWVRLEISGADLLAAGVEQGPAIGRGLAAALTAKLDGQTRGREDELRTALAAAGA